MAGSASSLTRAEFLVAVCLYDIFAGRAVRRLAGRSPEMPYHPRMFPLTRPITSVADRTDVVRVVVRGDGVEQLVPANRNGAANFSSVTGSAGFAIVPHDTEGLSTGEVV